MLATFLDDIRDGDHIVPKRLASRLRLHLTQLSKLAHVNRNAFSSKPSSAAVQASLGEIATIISRAAAMTEDEGAAIVWFKFQPLAGFGSKTAQDLVEDGRSEDVMLYLESLENGAYA